MRIDSRIVAIAMRDYHKSGFTHATMSGDAFNCAKQMIGSSDGKQYPNYDRWDKLFPKLSYDLDAFCRRSYWGGINYSWNKGLNKGGIRHYDIHNSYGSVMYWDPMPIGVPTLTHRWPLNGVLFIADLRVKMKLREGLRPWYQFRNGIDNIIEGWDHGTLVTETKHYHNLSLTSVDLAILSDWYEIDFDENYEPTFAIFKSRAGILVPYID